jgi:hypothetical protein
MKKLVIAFFFLAALLPHVWGVDFSAGVGGLLGYTFTRYTMEGGGAKSSQSMDRFDYAGFAFFDATYATFSILFQSGKNNWKETTTLNTATLPSGNGEGSSSSLVFSLMGKYPFTVNDQLTWFPLLGIAYHLTLSEKRKPEGYPVEYSRTKSANPADRDKNGKPYPLSAWNSFWIELGAGMDYIISGPLFLRTDVQFGFRLPTTYELGALEVVKKTFGVSDPQLKGLTGNPALKIAVGYRFYSI